MKVLYFLLITVFCAVVKNIKLKNKNINSDIEHSLGSFSKFAESLFSSNEKNFSPVKSLKESKEVSRINNSNVPVLLETSSKKEKIMTNLKRENKQNIDEYSDIIPLELLERSKAIQF